ncbi:hypothetical protein AB1Y20_015505 [Prymnesium parvum]|uniref:Uncharacterized protein n=1 Tax=Prymnesium parvum TaxID=97485 RepID=A0AB34K0Q4_PRYPA
MPYYGSLRHQRDCLTAPVLPAMMWGSLVAGLNIAQGAPLTPRVFAVNVGILYLYQALQCPMEAIHGRRSLLHNGLAAGSLGVVGVQAGFLGVPFVPLHILYSSKYNPLLIAFGMYGLIAMGIGSLGSKPL